VGAGNPISFHTSAGTSLGHVGLLFFIWCSAASTFWIVMLGIGPKIGGSLVITEYGNSSLVTASKCSFQRCSICSGSHNCLIVGPFNRSDVFNVLWCPVSCISVRAYDLAYDYPPPQRSPSHTQLVFPPPQKNSQVKRSQFWPSPPTDQSHTQCVRPPTKISVFTWKVTNFTSKIQYDEMIFAKNGRFAPIFASINIKSHYLQDLNYYIL